MGDVPSGHGNIGPLIARPDCSVVIFLSPIFLSIFSSTR